MKVCARPACNPFIQTAARTGSWTSAPRATGDPCAFALGAFAREIAEFGHHPSTAGSAPRGYVSGEPASGATLAQSGGVHHTITRPALVAAVALLAACATSPKKIPSTAGREPSAAALAELWVEPADLAGRDLFGGVGGARLAPDPQAPFTFVERDTKGSSGGYDVRDASGMLWSVKLGPEAQPEVVVSRLLWAAGYHQPPTYYVAGWELIEKGRQTTQPPGRFRPKLPGYRKVGRWSWQENPFVGSRPLRGLLVLNMLVNNWDLKTSQNVVYALDREREGARRWYVVRDIGASLGRTPGRIFDGTPNDLAGFEQQGFVTGVDGDHVTFDYHRPHNELFATITPADVQWACDRLARLSPRQWSDAFRAGGYDPEQSARYIRKLQAKIDAGRALGPR